MKLSLAIPVMSLFIGLSLWGEDFYVARTDHYLVRSALSPENAAETARTMEYLYKAFTELTGPPENHVVSLPVREFTSREELYAYLGDLKGEREGSFFLIGQSAYGEIAFFREPGRDSERALIELAFFQFADACNHDTPFWLKAGIARYFETLADRTDAASPPFNWDALGEWKTYGDGNDVSYGDLLALDGGDPGIGGREHSLSWALVTYLMNAQGRESRIFWESLTLLRRGDPTGWPLSLSGTENSSVRDYLMGLTPPEGVAEILKRLYATASHDEVLTYIAENNLDETWYGSYYRGLVSYDRGLYKKALGEFREAENRGASRAEALYAQALCLLQTGSREEAIALLRQVRDLREDLLAGELSRLLE